MVAEVASMEARLEKVSQGLPGGETVEQDINLTGGVPKPVKKTFAQPMSQAELDRRMKGAAIAVNAPAPNAPVARKVPGETPISDQPQITQQGAKPGAIDPFKSMAKDLGV
jgi:septal ring-binding cell division protein DamX